MIKSNRGKFIRRVEEGISLILIISLVMIIAISIFWRYVFRLPVPWSGEIAKSLLIWIVFIGATIAYGEKTHFKIDVFLKYIPFQIKKVLQIIIDTLTSIFLMSLCFASIKSIYLCWDYKALNIDISIGWLRLAFPIALSIMSIISINSLLRSLSALFKK